MNPEKSSKITDEHIELMIIKKIDKQNKELETIYVKKSDLNVMTNSILSANPYFKALKFFISLILLTFSVTLVGLVFLLFHLAQTNVPL